MARIASVFHGGNRDWGGKQAKRTRIPAEISVGSQLIVGGSANPVVGGIVGSVWSFPVERRHGGRRWGSSSELV
jgi:hypothetical protein